VEASQPSLFHNVEAALIQGVAWIELAIEVTGVLVIALGCLITAAELLRRAARRQPLDYSRSRLSLGRFLSLALEFQLASDILITAFSPSWEQLGKLAAIAAIRTALNFFLNLEIERAEPAAMVSTP
jgi:uncharacterized membrane protein